MINLCFPWPKSFPFRDDYKVIFTSIAKAGVKLHLNALTLPRYPICIIFSDCERRFFWSIDTSLIMLFTYSCFIWGFWNSWSEWTDGVVRSTLVFRIFAICDPFFNSTSVFVEGFVICDPAPMLMFNILSLWSIHGRCVRKDFVH